MSKDNFFEGFENHTLAKLELYRQYLSVYFRVILNTPNFKQINIYDFFCGKGTTDDGRNGSPIVAIFEGMDYNANLEPKVIKFHFNDLKESNVKILEEKIKIIDVGKSKNKLQIDCTIGDGIAKLVSLKDTLKQNKNHHSLIFVDPFGYTGIKPAIFFDLMACPNTEIILFMPVSHIYRFIKREIKEEGSMNTPALTNFVNSFFNTEEKQLIEKGNIDELIKLIRDVLRNKGQFYASVLKIPTEKKGNYNALFFITKNLKGLEKMLEAQWSIAKKDGYEVAYDPKQLNILDEIAFRGAVKEYLQEYRTNIELYEYILRKDRIINHMTELLRIYDDNLLFEMADGSKRRKNAYYLNYDAYKEEQPKYKVRWRNPQ